MDSLQTATWIDVNTNYTVNALPDRLPDAISIIHGSLFNLFNCPVGARGRIGSPTYGSHLLRFLQEPISESTATSIRVCLVQALTTWEPRIEVDFARTTVTEDYDLPGYKVVLAFRLLQGADTSQKSVSFSLKKA